MQISRPIAVVISGVIIIDIGKDVELRGSGAADSKVGDIAGEEVDDADESARIDVLKGKGEGSALWSFGGMG